MKKATGPKGFRETLRQVEEKSGEAEEMAGVIQWRPVSLWYAPGPTLVGCGVPGSHPRCVSLPRGAT